MLAASVTLAAAISAYADFSLRCIRLPLFRFQLSAYYWLPPPFSMPFSLADAALLFAAIIFITLIALRRQLLIAALFFITLILLLAPLVTPLMRCQRGR